MLLLQTLAALAVAFAAAVGLVSVLRRPAVAIGLVDAPCARRRHRGEIPVIGGVAIFLAFVVSLFLVAHLPAAVVTLVLGMSILMAMGLIDDILDIPAIPRLLVQVLVAGVMVVWGGVEIRTLGNLFGFGEVGLGAFSIPFTVLCTVFMINAMNMADGMDGLAGGMAVVILSMLALFGWLGGKDPGLISVALVLATATLGFLVFNLRSPFRSRATVFMGDAGSMMLGFAIAWVTISMARNGGGQIPPVALAWVLLLPAMDTFAVSLRRMARGRSPLAPDRTHLHHLVGRCGFSIRSTVRALLLLTLAGGLVGLIGWYFVALEPLLFWLAAVLFVSHAGILLAAGPIMMRIRRRIRPT